MDYRVDNLNEIFRKKQELTVGVIVNTLWLSTFLALILSSLSCHIHGNLFFTRNILLGVVIGFGLQFVGLAYSKNISESLLRMIS